MTLRDEVDAALAETAWSLWAELGVASNVRHHQNCLILPEELIILTAVIADSDPRLRNEALDWCSKYHHFVSVARLKAIAYELDDQIFEPLSIFNETLNSIANTKWPVFKKVDPLKVKLSGKSELPPLNLPSLLSLRLRSLLGIGIRADLLTFCLTRPLNSSFTAIDTVKIGYNKRSLAEVLESFVEAGILRSTFKGNRKEYILIKQHEIIALAGYLPKYAPNWSHILEVFLSLRSTIGNYENYSPSSKSVISKNALEKFAKRLEVLNLPPPIALSDHESYMRSFNKWLINSLKDISQNNFWGGSVVQESELLETQVGLLMQHVHEIQDCLDGLETTIHYALERPKNDKTFRENREYSLRFTEDLIQSLHNLLKFPIYKLADFSLLDIASRFELEDFPQFISESNRLKAREPATIYFRELRDNLDRVYSFLHRLEERIKKIFNLYTDINLLTLSDVLTRRHIIYKLFD